jgi:hypothetical protein
MMIIDTNGDKNKDAFKQSLSTVSGVLSTSFCSRPVVETRLPIQKFRTNKRYANSKP